MSGDARASAEVPVAVAIKPTRDEQDVSIARKVFFAGCVFLPWLWILLLLRYRARYYEASCPADLKKCSSRRRRCALLNAGSSLSRESLHLSGHAPLALTPLRPAVGPDRRGCRDGAAAHLDLCLSDAMENLGRARHPDARLPAFRTVVEQLIAPLRTPCARRSSALPATARRAVASRRAALPRVVSCGVDRRSF